MPITVQATSGKTALGLYLFQLKDVTEDIGKDFKSGQAVDQYKFVWTIKRSLEAEPTEEQEAAIGTEYWEWTKRIATPSSKLRARIDALLGREMRSDEDVDLETFIGQVVRATVAEDTLSDGRKYVALITVPYRQRSARPAEPVKPAAAPDADGDLDEESLPF